MLGASVDNIRTCECTENCPKVVVEYKCPWKHRHLPAKEAFLTKEIGGIRSGDTFSLNVTSSYHFQVQLQMFVCNIQFCDFVVWTEQGIFSLTVAYNDVFITSLCKKLETFWLIHVLPSMVKDLIGSDSKSIIDKTVADTLDLTEILTEDVNVPQLDKTVSETLDLTKITEDDDLPLHVTVDNLNIYDTCIQGLQPKGMLNDNIVALLLNDICCQFPVLSSFFYTVLCGEQETKTPSRNSRCTRAEMFFKPELWKEDFIFIPINRSSHWFLGAITPWHIIVMDSLAWDVSARRNEFSLIFSFMEHLCSKYGLPRKHLNLSYKALKAPQQEIDSNNCGIYTAMFLKHFLETLDEYEANREEYCNRIHTWFSAEEVEVKRTNTRKYLENLMILEQYSKM